MSDHGQAQIIIGGRIEDNTEFVKQIHAAEAQLDWGDARFQPNNTADILGALYCEPAPKKWRNRLVLCDERASWGCFEELEEWLVKNHIPFDRYSGQVGEHLPEMVCFRKGWKKSEKFPNRREQPRRTAL